MLSWVEGEGVVVGSNKSGKSNENCCYIIVIKSFTFPIDSSVRNGACKLNCDSRGDNGLHYREVVVASF